MMVTDISCWWHDQYVGDCMLVSLLMYLIDHQHLKSCTDLPKLSSTQFVFNIRRQHRCNLILRIDSRFCSNTQFWPGLEVRVGQMKTRFDARWIEMKGSSSLMFINLFRWRIQFRLYCNSWNRLQGKKSGLYEQKRWKKDHLTNMSNELCVMRPNKLIYGIENDFKVTDRYPLMIYYSFCF